MPQGLLITPVSADRGFEERVLEKEALFPQGKVAVIDVDGVLLNASERSIMGKGEHPVSRLLEQLDMAREDHRVKAVVLRINSPGGSVTASELMHSELRRFKDSGKPVVSIMLDVAASGAYYIACATDEIIACHSTVTGSIGVIMSMFEVTGTMQKLGVTANMITSGPQKASGSPFTPLTPEQQKIFQGIVNDFYQQFVDVVAAGRPELTREQIVHLADGRVYTADQALANGLIDRIGTMRDAIGIAKKRAGITSAEIVVYTRPYGYRANYYSTATIDRTNVNLLNVEMGDVVHSLHPPFMYLWTQP